MAITITDDIYDLVERLLRSPVEQAASYLRDTRRILQSRFAELEFVPEQHARAQALIARIDAALHDCDHGYIRRQQLADRESAL